MLNSQDLTLQRIHYFLTVAETGSLNKAALSLGTGKPAVRRSIQELEQRLGIDLFVRTSRGIHLTDAGRRFHDRCSPLQSVGNVAAPAAGRHAPSGRVAIAMPPIAAKLVAAPLLRQLESLYPEMRVLLLEGYSLDAREWLNEGIVEIGLFYDSPGADRTFATPVLVEHLALVGRFEDKELLKNSPMPLSQALRLPLLIPGIQHCGRFAIESMAQALGIRLNVAMEVEALSSMVSLAAAGVGYALLPAFAVAEEVQAGLLNAVPLDPVLSRTLLIGTSPRRRTSARAELLMPILTRLLAQSGSSGRHSLGGPWTRRSWPEETGGAA